MAVKAHFTSNGAPVGTEIDPFQGEGEYYNDIHLTVDRGGNGRLFAVEFTKDGKIVGIPVDGIMVGSLIAPIDANDVGFDISIEAHDFAISTVYWTKDGEPIGQPRALPPGVNDVHVILWHEGRFKEAWWTHNRVKQTPVIEVHPAANDFHMGDPDHFPWKKQGR
jgi:hypothetical protein